MEGECINMQEDAPEVFGDSCLGRLFAQFIGTVFAYLATDFRNVFGT